MTLWYVQWSIVRWLVANIGVCIWVYITNTHLFIRHSIFTASILFTCSLSATSFATKQCIFHKYTGRRQCTDVYRYSDWCYRNRMINATGKIKEYLRYGWLSMLFVMTHIAHYDFTFNFLLSVFSFLHFAHQHWYEARIDMV